MVILLIPQTTQRLHIWRLKTQTLSYNKSTKLTLSAFDQTPHRLEYAFQHVQNEQFEIKLISVFHKALVFLKQTCAMKNHKFQPTGIYLSKANME